MDVASLPMTSPTPSPSTVAYKPVFGKGREKRWADFQEIFRTVQDDYGTELITDAETRKDLRYRLIVAIEGKNSEKAIGIVIFSQQLSNSYSLLGLKYAFNVRAIHLLSYPENLWSELMRLAKSCNSNAESILLRVSKRDAQLAKSLERALFTMRALVADPDRFDFYGSAIEKEDTETSGNGRSPGKRDRMTVKPSSDINDNRLSKGMRIEDAEKNGI